MIIINQFRNLSLPFFQLLMLMTSSLLAIHDAKTFKVSPLVFNIATPLILLCYALEIGISHFHFLFFLVLFFISNLIIWLFPAYIGGGDLKLLLSWSLVLSPIQFIWLLFYASSSALLWILLWKMITRKTHHKIPFVPFLTIGLFLFFL